MKASAKLNWARVFTGWLLSAAFAFVALSVLVPLMLGNGVSLSGASLLGIIPAWIVTFPALLLRVILGPEQGFLIAMLVGAGFALLYALFTYELFLPLGHRMTGGPSLSVFGVYAIVGAMAGAIWLAVERRRDE